MINKNYRNGAEDVGEIASEAFESIGNKLKSSSDDFKVYNEEQTAINDELINIAEGHEKRLGDMEYKLPSIDFDLVDHLPSEKRALIGGIIRSIFIPDEQCRITTNLLISRLGIEPFSIIDFEKVALLSSEVQRICTFYLYLILRKAKGNLKTLKSVDKVLDEFSISNTEKRKIKSVIEEYDVEWIDEYIRVGRGGKQNVIVLGKSDALSSTLINTVLGRVTVNEGFYQEPSSQIRSLESRDTPIRFCGVHKVGYDKELNAKVLKTVHDTIQNKSGENRISNIWYCLSSRSNRVEPYELILLKELIYSFKDVKTTVVFTHTLSKKNTDVLAKVIQEGIMCGKIEFAYVLTEEIMLDNGQKIEPYGIKELIDQTKKN